MLNLRILSAWPNYLIIPAMVALWVVAGVLVSEILGMKPWHQES